MNVRTEHKYVQFIGIIFFMTYFENPFLFKKTFFPVLSGSVFLVYLGFALQSNHSTNTRFQEVKVCVNKMCHP